MNEKNKIIEQGYWNDFYAKWVISIPSQFCVGVATELHNRVTVVEFGSGNGRDSLYLATQGHIVVALDLSVEAINKCNQLMESRGVKHATFMQGDMSDESSVSSAINNARQRVHAEYPELAFYSRFVMHTLDDEQETAFLSALSKYMRPSERVYFEFRSKEDSKTNKYFGNHYRRYVDEDVFGENLKRVYGFAIDYKITGQGMAKYKEEDPFVTRIIARKL
jgi:tellurite methyltransferase